MGDYHRISSRLCSQCSRNNTRSSAVKWCQMCGQSLCEDCISTHRRDPTTHLHTVTDLSQTSENLPPFPPCTHHPGENVEMICEDCNKAICIKCSRYFHAKCHVALMDARAKKIKDKVTAENTKIQSKIEDASALLTGYKSKYDLLEFYKTYERDLIEDAFHKLISYIYHRKTMLLRELYDVMEKQINKILDDIQQEENRLQLYQQRVHFIAQAVQSGALFDMYIMCQSLMTEDESETDNIKQPVRVLEHAKYHVNSEELMERMMGLDFGIIHVEQESYSTRVLKSNNEYTFLDDKHRPFLRDITVLGIGDIHTIVVTDTANKCVKSLYTRNSNLCDSRLVLASTPKGITQLSKNKVMVAVPFSKQIITVSVTPDLELLSSIPTNERYYSLAVMGESLAAGREDNVDILNMTGQVMKSVSTHNNTALFPCPLYMCVSNTGQLLVSDFYSKRVTCLTREGDVVWSYTGTGDGRLRHPNGITTTPTGDILVVDKYFIKVLQLSGTVEYVGNIITIQESLRDLWGICVDKHGSLFVCDENVIKQY